MLPSVQRALLHDYAEPLSAEIQVYSLPEIVAEKLRALLQSRTRLMARGWGASRVCRDYYDLWSILRRERHRIQSLRALVERKCAWRQLKVGTLEDFFDAALQQIAQTEWEAQILPFVFDAPAPEQVILELRSSLEGLWE